MWVRTAGPLTRPRAQTDLGHGEAHRLVVQADTATYYAHLE